MAMRLKSDLEILDPAVRKKIIEEIEGNENKRRKDEAYRRWQVYKDKTSTFVTDLLLEQFSEETVREMSYSITNISIVRKIINKLSRVYLNGATRSIAENEDATEKLAGLSDFLNFDQRMKMQNRITKLQKNSVNYIKPCPFIDDDGETKMRVRISPLNPYLYDAIEEFYDRTKPLCYVLNNYSPGSILHTSLDPAKVRSNGGHLRAGFSTHVSPSSAVSAPAGDGIDQKIADKKEDENAALESEKIYIWWSDHYHFTTKGNVMIDADGVPFEPEGVDDERIQNDIEEMPFVNFAVDQDNSFWSEGGEDLVDAGIVVNSMLTQVNHIGVVQGYGQFWMRGKNLPRNQTVGPNKAVILEYEDGDPVPEVGFATANPPLRELMQNVESLVALTLTTNDLSTSGVSADLDGGGMAPSGIALMIDKAESLEDVADQRQMFIDAEQDIWRITAKWMQHFDEQGTLDPEMSELKIPEDMELNLEFQEAGAISTEKEKLESLKLRKDLGINTMVDLIMIDQPALDLKQAEEKLKKIEDEKLERMDEFVNNMPEGGPDIEGDENGDKGKENPFDGSKDQ